MTSSKQFDSLRLCHLVKLFSCRNSVISHDNLILIKCGGMRLHKCVFRVRFLWRCDFLLFFEGKTKLLKQLAIIQVWILLSMGLGPIDAIWKSLNALRLNLIIVFLLCLHNLLSQQCLKPKVHLVCRRMLLIPGLHLTSSSSVSV